MESEIFKEKCIYDLNEQCYALKEKNCKWCNFFKSEKEWQLVDLKGTYIKTAAKRGKKYESN